MIDDFSKDYVTKEANAPTLDMSYMRRHKGWKTSGWEDKEDNYMRIGWVTKEYDRAWMKGMYTNRCPKHA